MTNDLREAVLGGRYRVVRLLGDGALGSVYEAKSGPFGRRCAVKVLHPQFANDEEVVQRFKREARAAASLKHAHIVEVSDFGMEQGRPFLVMELLAGQSLRDLLKRQKRIAPERAARIGVQVLSALAVAHDANIVHRDIKPENVFLTTTAASVDMVKVLDFGSAKLLGETDGKPLTVTGMVIGTLSFMPPEQALGRRVDGRADLYALAATLYAAIAGRKVLDASHPADLLTAVVKREPELLTSVGVKVDAGFEAILRKALKKDPAERYRSAREMSAALTAWLETAPKLTPDISTITPGGVAMDAHDDSYRRVRLPRAGSTLGRYHLDELLGAGGLGQVFRAKDTTLDRAVAVKVLRVARDPDETGLPVRAAARVLVEARAAAKIRHPNVVEVFDVHYSVDGIAYLVMELVPGKTLRHYIGDPYLPIERKIGWLIGVARALSAAHAQGVVHQDIKPENVMVRDDDGAVKVLDFGIARRIFENDSSLPGTETLERIPGTPVYMAPEQMRGAKGTAATDQFTWAVFAYELLTGALPWLQHGGVLHVVHEILTRDPEAPSRRRSDVPREIDEVVSKALSKRPEDRYASMSEVADALAAGWARAAARPIDEIVVRRPPRRAMVVAAAAAMALLCGSMAPLDEHASKASAAKAELGAPDFGSAMSPNAAAVSAYVDGIAALHDAAGGSARKSFDQAIQADPSFAAAHLRKVLATAVVTDAERESVLKATQLRDALGEHDRGLLRAIEPWVGVPQDAVEVEHRLVALTAAHYDADYLYQLCRFRVLAGNYAGALESCRAAREIDGTFAGAYWLEAQAELFLNDTQRGSDTLDTCLRISPKATSCINDLFYLRTRAGTCDAALGSAQELVSLEPANATWLDDLGMASYAMDRSIASVRTAFERSWDVLPAERVPYVRTWTRANLAVLTGDFDEAREDLGALDRIVDGNNDEYSHRSVLRLRALYHREVGNEGKLVGPARAFLADRQAWSPSSDEDSTIDALIVLYRGGGLTRRQFIEARESWLTRERSQPRPAGRFGMGPGRQWIHAYADAVVTPEDARDALAVIDRYRPLPPDRFRDTEDDEAIGRAYLLAERPDDALPFLRRAAQSCEAARFPFQHTWANLELGRALEATDRAGACAAYQIVTRRWAAASSSPSAQIANDRRKALGCR